MGSILVSRFLLDLQRAIRRTTYGDSLVASEASGLTNHPLVFRTAVEELGSVLLSDTDSDDSFEAHTVSTMKQPGDVEPQEVLNLEDGSGVSCTERVYVRDSDGIEEVSRR